MFSRLAGMEAALYHVCPSLYAQSAIVHHPPPPPHPMAPCLTPLL